MQCVEELSPETCFDLDEIEALPVFDVPDFMPDLPAIAFTFADTVTTSATSCTYSFTLVSENSYDGVFCYAESPFGLCSEEAKTIESAVEKALEKMGLSQDPDNIYPLLDDFAGVKNPAFSGDWDPSKSIHGKARESGNIPGVDPKLNLKYYNDPDRGQIIAPVSPTDSLRHYLDAIQWKLGGNPNLRNAKEILKDLQE